MIAMHNISKWRSLAVNASMRSLCSWKPVHIRPPRKVPRMLQITRTEGVRRLGSTTSDHNELHKLSADEPRIVEDMVMKKEKQKAIRDAKKDKQKMIRDEKHQHSMDNYLNDVGKLKRLRSVKRDSKRALQLAEFYISTGYYKVFMERLMKSFEENDLEIPNEVHAVITRCLFTQADIGDNPDADYALVLHHCVTATQAHVCLDATALAYCLAAAGRLLEADHASRDSIRAQLAVVMAGTVDPASVFTQSSVANSRLRGDMLRGVHLLLPHYSPPWPATATSPQYTVPLLQCLNHDQEYELPVNRSLPTSLPNSARFAGYDAVEEQMQLESRADVQIPSVAARQLGRRQSSVIEQWKHTWRQQLTWGLDKKMQRMRKIMEKKKHGKFPIRAHKTFTKGQHYPILAAVGSELLVDIMMHEIEVISEEPSPQNCERARLERVGYLIMCAYNVEMMRRTGQREVVLDVHSHYCERLALQEGDHLLPRVLYDQLFRTSHQHGEYLEAKKLDLDWGLIFGVGRFVYDVMKEHTQLSLPLKMHNTAHIPLLRDESITIGFKKLRMVVVHEAVRDLIPRQKFLRFLPRELPMLCPPAPWTSDGHGGYLAVSTPGLVRMVPSIDEAEQITAMFEGGSRNIRPYLDSLNQLSATPWKVNGRVLDTILELFQSNSGAELDVPPCPSTLRLPKKRSEAEMENYHKTKSEMYSLWRTSLYKLSIANFLRDRTFWFPHNMDFRGRAYAIPPHLNHLSNDVFRAVLHFGETKALGEEGLRWLKIHIINLTGKAKRQSIAERLAMCEDCIDDIRDSAQNPLDGKRWWTSSDEPWQTLAACIDLNAALSLEDPSQHESRLPIHQDGSCNGLQHYAALGKDTLGAKSVNLVPALRPADVYSDVADMATQLMQRHIEDPTCPQHAAARLLEGRITRKIVKPTVMTSVYGVSHYGAKLQMRKTILDSQWDDISPEEVGECANYLAYLVFASLNETFASATAIQDWLTDCAIDILRKRGAGISWTTPLGMEIVQPYYKNITSKQIEAIADRKKMPEKAIIRYPDTNKQRNGFAPNFIHSLDATHMMLTSLHCQTKDITFATVHDCFWTHASSVPVMNEICRDQFIALYHTPILEDLSESFLQKWGYVDEEFDNDGNVKDGDRYRLNHLMGRPPKQGDFDVRQVRNSTFFFS